MVIGQWVDIWFQQELVKVRIGFLSVRTLLGQRGGVWFGNDISAGIDHGQLTLEPHGNLRGVSWPQCKHQTVAEKPPLPSVVSPIFLLKP